MSGTRGSQFGRCVRQEVDYATRGFVEARQPESEDEEEVGEEEAKKAWLARLDAPTWGAVAAAVTVAVAMAHERLAAHLRRVVAAPR